MENLKITPMLKQFLDVKDQHPDKLILFRMGDFYETFFDDAKLASKVLGITLTSRNKSDEQAIPLAGFPYHALDNYLDKLVRAGLKIVICEQMEDPKLAKGLVKREIVEIITPGAILDDQLIDKSANNFLASIYWQDYNKKIGISNLDISTGDFFFTELESSQLRNEIQRMQPVEIVTINKQAEEMIKDLKLEYTPALTIFDSWQCEPKEAQRILKDHFGVKTLEGFGALNKTLGATSAGIALAYLKSLRTEDLKHINQLHYYSLQNHMQLDEISRRNLELFRSMRYGTKFGSLLNEIDKTQTPMGARLLAEWLSSPLLDQKMINRRLFAVKEFKENITRTNELRTILNTIGDLSRIISKVATMRANPRDLIGLSGYLSTAPAISRLIDGFDSEYVAGLKTKIKDYSTIINLIENTIVDAPPIVITEGNLIKDKVHPDLDELRQISRDGKGWIARLEAQEKQKTGISSLKVGYNKVFGYYIEVTNLHKEKIPDYYICKQTLSNAERYISPQLKEYESKVLGAEDRIRNLEHEIFNKLRLELSSFVEVMQEYVGILGVLDVLSNLGFIAYHYGYCEPQFNTEGILEIRDCRHPVIERLLENEEYIPNDVLLDNSENRIALITGPNMAGKSTYLRQIGLSVILAQTGSFVPAKYANLPIFDKVFTRVGASDNLAMGQSTFLVEMIETANILNSATPDSLILLDEIGRGTSTFDGLSLAWSIVEYIHNNAKLKAKTLFATHYHELTELENLLPGVKNYNILVKEWNDKMIFLRKIERGSADQSYGIQVARLAGVPDKVIRRAKQILKNLEELEISPQGLSSRLKKQLNKDSEQLDIFSIIIEQQEGDSQKISELEEELEELDINNLTPMEALQTLVRFKEIITKK